MHRIDLPQAGIAMRFPPDFRPRDVPADWCNAVQEEICHVIESQGRVLNETHTQLKEAVDHLFELPENPSVFAVADLAMTEGDGSRAIPLPWTPVDSTLIREIRFLATVVKRVLGSNENIYSTTEEKFCFFQGEWAQLKRGQCKLSPDGYLFWKSESEWNLFHRAHLTPRSLIISHVERILV